MYQNQQPAEGATQANTEDSKTEEKSENKKKKDGPVEEGQVVSE
jgi:hypothetical protein